MVRIAGHRYLEIGVLGGTGSYNFLSLYIYFSNIL
jgi:hypothetical protein